ncbi:PROTEIN NLP8 [Salix koriyanagi]|uniref:PROTEIN NLP8 n=1 Tax=Salix koriyanagi TaxID=2511006 RepID=A0A9Q0X4V0_9ROSI|nr:PROTEIN NLP8 [Salix koriyanagi]
MDGHKQNLKYHGCSLAVASAWKFTDPPQSSSGLCEMQDRVDGSEEMASSSKSEDDEENDPCIMAVRNLWCTQLLQTKLFDILEYICPLYDIPDGQSDMDFYNGGGNTNSNEKRILCIDYSACYTLMSVDKFVGAYTLHRVEEGQGVAGKALQSNIHIQHDISVLDPADFPDSDSQRLCQNRTFNASFAIRLTSTHSCKDDYVLEFFLPYGMEDTSKRELLISKVLRTLQENCLESWKVWVRELNEASGNGVGLDDERMSNIPHEAISSIFQLPSFDGVLGGNEFMTFNPTNDQAGETHEPLEQVLFLFG